jgi:hypothetical protein
MMRIDAAALSQGTFLEDTVTQASQVARPHGSQANVYPQAFST